MFAYQNDQTSSCLRITVLVKGVRVVKARPQKISAQVRYKDGRQKCRRNFLGFSCLDAAKAFVHFPVLPLFPLEH